MERKVLSRVKPNGDEHRDMQDFTHRLIQGLSEQLWKSGMNAVAEVHGSAVRDTWLKGEKDVDIFLVLDPQNGRPAIHKALEAVKIYLGEGWVEAYAEHPYLQAEIEGFKVEFVPCFRVDPGEGLISSTDRTPLHTKFLEQHLTTSMRDQVRLLKKFMQGIGLYGAEVKVGGFSGYLCEILVIHFGSFEAVLRSASKWEKREVMDPIEAYDPKALRKKFNDPLIVLDPVDPTRNMASAVSETSMWTFTAAARAFLKKPSVEFFFPESRMIEAQDILKSISRRGTNVVFVVLKDEEVDVPDVLWGQLYKALNAIKKLLKKREFGVLRIAAWSDEASCHILIFELENSCISEVKKFKGPPVEMAESSQRFLAAHKGSASTVSGPWIEGSRWWVATRRKQWDSVSLLASIIKEDGTKIGIPRKLSRKMAERGRILKDEEISEYLQGEFINFLNRFLEGRPDWLE